ncbi:MAG: hypothetical protein RIE31_05135 [Alphaproteobacteria bacterium]
MSILAPLSFLASTATGPMSLAGIGLSGLLQAQRSLSAAAIDRVNAKSAAEDARLARERGARREQTIRQQTERDIARQRARFARSGVQIAGSPLLALEDLAATGELDALDARAGGEAEALRRERQATQRQLSSVSHAIGGVVGAGSSLLSGGGALFRPR